MGYITDYLYSMHSITKDRNIRLSNIENLRRIYIKIPLIRDCLFIPKIHADCNNISEKSKQPILGFNSYEMFLGVDDEVTEFAYSKALRMSAFRQSLKKNIFENEVTYFAHGIILNRKGTILFIAGIEFTDIGRDAFIINKHVFDTDTKINLFIRKSLLKGCFETNGTVHIANIEDTTIRDTFLVSDEDLCNALVLNKDMLYEAL